MPDDVLMSTDTKIEPTRLMLKLRPVDVGKRDKST